MQFVPEIAPEVQRLTVFQRTGNWFMPRKNRPYPQLVRSAVERVPGLQAFRRSFVFQYSEALTATIRHPRTVGRLAAWRSACSCARSSTTRTLRRKVWPDYTFGCKRVLFSSMFLPALQRPNVELVTESIVRVEPNGIVTADGTEHELDCIIWATGFRTNDFMFPMEINGSEGRNLREAVVRRRARPPRHDRASAFPNMFVMYGPNTNTSGGSIIVYLEAQAAYMRQAL